MLSPSAYWLLLLAMAAYAFGRGRIDERLAAGICVIGSMATVIVSSPLNEKYSSVETGVLIVDSLALLGFVLLALGSRRFWPL